MEVESKVRVIKVAGVSDPIQDTPVRRSSLGYFSMLPDSMILHVFKYLNAQDLCTCSLVSRVMNVFAEEEELWKTLTIKKKIGDFLFQGTWKRTCLLERNQKKNFPYKRIAAPGFVSDYLYRTWYRCHVPVENFAKVEVQHIDRRSNLSLEEFIEKYDKPRKPVIITDIISKWKASTAWKKENLLKKYGNQTFKTDEVEFKARKKLWMMLSDYFEYCKTNHDEDPIYLFDDKLGDREETKEILGDFNIPIYFQQDYFELLEDERPPYRWLVIGPQRSGSPFHLDPYRTSAWNGLISGRKRWAFYPEGQFPPGIDLEFDEDGNFDHDSPEPIKWFLDVYPHLKPSQKPLECILEPGELIFVPSGVWHMVLNLEDTIAVTQNFCNDQNFDIVCHELDFDDEETYEDFYDKVSKKYPNKTFPMRGSVTSGFKV